MVFSKYHRVINDDSRIIISKIYIQNDGIYLAPLCIESGMPCATSSLFKNYIDLVCGADHAHLAAEPETSKEDNYMKKVPSVF